MTKPNLGEIEEMSETFIVQIIMALFVCLFLYMLYINGFLLFNMKIADFAKKVKPSDTVCVYIYKRP